MVEPLDIVLIAGFLIRFGLVIRIVSPLVEVADANDTTLEIIGCGCEIVRTIVGCGFN